MSVERFAHYEFEISGGCLPESGKWAAYLEIRVRPDGQDHAEVIFPKQRISGEDVFDTESEAVDEARRFARAHVSSGEF